MIAKTSHGKTNLKKSLLAILFLACLPALAETHAWITDKLEVQMRAGPGNQYRIVKSLPSGTELIVGVNKDTEGYTRVSLESGEEGWVLTRYLISTPAPTLTEENQRLKSELEALKLSKENAEKSNQQMNEETSRLNSEVVAIRQASANVLQIQSERDQLTHEKASLESQLDTLKREKESQDASNQQDLFLIGAGVLFGGIVGSTVKLAAFCRRPTMVSERLSTVGAMPAGGHAVA